MDMTRRGVVAVVLSLALVATVALITSKDGGDAVLQSYRSSGRMMPPMMQAMQAPRMPVNSFAMERATANALDNDLNNFLRRPMQPAARRVPARHAVPHTTAPRHEMAPTEQLLETSEEQTTDCGTDASGRQIPNQIPPFSCSNPDPHFSPGGNPYAVLYPNNAANVPQADPIGSQAAMSADSAGVAETVAEGLHEAITESEPESSGAPEMMNPDAAAWVDEEIGDEQAEEFTKSDDQISEIDKEYEAAEKEEEEEDASVAPVSTPTAVTDEITDAGIAHVSSPTPMTQEATPTPPPTHPANKAHGFWGGGGVANAQGEPSPVSPTPPPTDDPNPDSTEPQRTGCGGGVPDQMDPFDCAHPDPQFDNEPYSDSATEDPLVHHHAASALTETRQSMKTAPAGGAKAAALKVQKAADNKIAQLKQATQAKELKYKKALALVKQTSQDIKGVH